MNPAQLQQMLRGLQDQLNQVQSLIGMPGAATPQFGLGQIPVAQQSSAKAVQAPAVALGQQELLLKMYDEFAETDDGKALAAGLQKFARFVQSKVAKSEG